MAQQTRDVALAFARALLEGRHDDAHALLVGPARGAWTPATLAARYDEMVGYFEIPPSEVEIVTTMEAWPAKQPGDVEWVYISIHGETEGEAVTVIVAAEGDVVGVREIEWGRP
jgi:hypothetical protein